MASNVNPWNYFSAAANIAGAKASAPYMVAAQGISTIGEMIMQLPGQYQQLRQTELNYQRELEEMAVEKARSQILPLYSDAENALAAGNIGDYHHKKLLADQMFNEFRTAVPRLGGDSTLARIRSDVNMMGSQKMLQDELNPTGFSLNDAMRYASSPDHPDSFEARRLLKVNMEPGYYAMWEAGNPVSESKKSAWDAYNPTTYLQTKRINQLKTALTMASTEDQPGIMQQIQLLQQGYAQANALLNDLGEVQSPKTAWNAWDQELMTKKPMNAVAQGIAASNPQDLAAVRMKVGQNEFPKDDIMFPATGSIMGSAGGMSGSPIAPGSMVYEDRFTTDHAQRLQEVLSKPPTAESQAQLEKLFAVAVNKNGVSAAQNVIASQVKHLRRQGFSLANKVRNGHPEALAQLDGVVSKINLIALHMGMQTVTPDWFTTGYQKPLGASEFIPLSQITRPAADAKPLRQMPNGTIIR